VNERDIFHEAIELTNPVEQSAYLEKVCAGNAPLRQHVEKMLEIYPQLGTFLESPAVNENGSASLPASAGHFRLGQELAHGGMGVVYSARDESLGRDVAVKILHERYLVDSIVGQRFQDEARITAQLQHPAIPPVFEVGRLDDDRPYLAMKLIKGRTLEDLLKERLEPASERGRFLAVFQQVCQAVGYAHSKHILHRDLKPANVMVGAFGEVQVMDWGLAKLLAPGSTAAHEPSDGREITTGTVTDIRTARTDDSGTLAGSMLGTPAFMAPEQAGGELDRLDERTDVFGLGAILCVILTGKPPYSGKSGEEVRLMAIRGKLADAQARLERCGADPKLVELCRACLSLEREARPRDAGAVAAAVAGYLAGVEERVRQAELERAAAEVRTAEQRKRRRVKLTLAASVLLALVCGIAATAWQALRATLAEADAVAQKTAALREADRNRRLLYSADVHLVSQTWQSEEGTVAQCKDLLLAHVPGPGQTDLREFSWRYQWRLLHRDSVVPLPVVPRAAGVAAGDRVVTLDENGWITAWQFGDYELHETLSLAKGGVVGVTLARNGEVAAVIDRDGLAQVFDVLTGLQKVSILPPAPLVNLKLSADGRFLVGVCRDEHARVWDTASGTELYDHQMIDATATQIDLSMDGKQLLASVGSKSTLAVLYQAGAKEPKVLHDQEATAGFISLQGALSPDGKLAAVGIAGNSVDLYDTTTGKGLCVLLSRSRPIRVVFSPDGNYLAVGEKTGLITLWRIPRPLLLADQQAVAQKPVQNASEQPNARNLKGHEGAIETLTFTRDGRKLISISHDHTARCWDVGDQEESRVVEKGRSQIDGLGYSPDGRHLVLASMTDGIRVHDLTSGDPPLSLTGRGARRAVFSPDGLTIAGGPDHRVTLWNAKTGELLGTLAEAEPAEVGAMTFAPDSRWLAVGIGGPNTFATDVPGKVMVFDVARRKELRTFAASTQISAVGFSPDGKLMAAAGHDGTVWLWDGTSWAEIARWQGPAGSRYASILFLSGGQELAVGTVSGVIDLWDVRTRALTRQIRAHIDCVSVMALSPDGRTLATASWDRTIKLWDSGTGRELRTLFREEAWMYALAFSPDGNTLASGGLSAVLRLWEASTKEAVAADLAALELRPKTNRP
jgi:WD40 repeat protein